METESGALDHQPAKNAERINVVVATPLARPVVPAPADRFGGRLLLSVPMSVGAAPTSTCRTWANHGSILSWPHGSARSCK
jgi:hypothetical protein